MFYADKTVYEDWQTKQIWSILFQFKSHEKALL